jgi:hypothetical protein
MPIEELTWHFDVPFWNSYNLKPVDVLNNPDKYQEEYSRTMKADLVHPLDIMFWKKRWLLLDGLHRLLKAKIIGQDFVEVRKVPVSMIDLIKK